VGGPPRPSHTGLSTHRRAGALSPGPRAPGSNGPETECCYAARQPRTRPIVATTLADHDRARDLDGWPLMPWWWSGHDLLSSTGHTPITCPAERNSTPPSVCSCSWVALFAGASILLRAVADHGAAGRRASLLGHRRRRPALGVPVGDRRTSVPPRERGRYAGLLRPAWLHDLERPGPVLGGLVAAYLTWQLDLLAANLPLRRRGAVPVNRSLKRLPQAVRQACIRCLARC